MKVKQLEWSEGPKGTINTAYFLPLGVLYLEKGSQMYILYLGTTRINFLEVDTLNEAKAEAQEWFEAQVLNLLENEDES